MQEKLSKDNRKKKIEDNRQSMRNDKKRCSAKQEKSSKKRSIRMELLIVAINKASLKNTPHSTLKETKVQGIKPWNNRSTNSLRSWLVNTWWNSRRILGTMRQNTRKWRNRYSLSLSSAIPPSKYSNQAWYKCNPLNSPSSTANWQNNYTLTRMTTHRPRRHFKGFSQPWNLLRSLGQFPQQDSTATDWLTHLKIAKSSVHHH